MHEDLKQLGGQDSGHEKQQGTEPCIFFSKKLNIGYHHARDRKLVCDEIFKLCHEGENTIYQVHIYTVHTHLVMATWNMPTFPLTKSTVNRLKRIGMTVKQNHLHNPSIYSRALFPLKILYTLTAFFSELCCYLDFSSHNFLDFIITSYTCWGTERGVVLTSKFFRLIIF